LLLERSGAISYEPSVSISSAMACACDAMDSVVRVQRHSEQQHQQRYQQFFAEHAIKERPRGVHALNCIA
jgi:hypothetical protein